MLVALAVGTSLTLTSHTDAGIWIGSANCLHLGQNDPSGADQNNKKTQLKNIFVQNSQNMLQEVMVTSEMPNVTPSGYYYKVSALKGSSSYKEAYGFVYKTSVSGGIVDFTGTGYERPPSGLLTWTGSAYQWCVNYHAVFDATPNAQEIQKLNTVYTFYKGRSSVNGVVIAGDFNRTGTSSYFNNLKNTGCNQILPNVATSINSSGSYVNPYDHFCWNPTYTTINYPSREEIDPVYWRANVSDHAPIYGLLY